MIKNWTIKVIADFSDLFKKEQKTKTLFEETNLSIKEQEIKLKSLIKQERALLTIRERVARNTNERSKKTLAQIDREIESINKEKETLKGLEQQTKKTAKGLDNISKSAKAVAGALGFAFGAGVLLRFEKQLFDTAKQMEAFKNRSKAVFGESEQIVKDFAKENANSLGLTRNEFLGAAAAIGDLLEPLVFTGEKSAQVSSEILNLASAIKIFRNDTRSTVEISEILAKALSGQTIRLKTLDIMVNQTSEDFKDLVKQKVRDEGITVTQAKAEAIYATILEQSSLALQKQSEETGTLATKEQELIASAKELKEVFANTLFPVFDSLLSNLLNIKNAFTDGIGSIRDFGDTIFSVFKLASLANPVGLWVTILRGFREEVDITADAISDLGGAFDFGAFGIPEVETQIRNVAFFQAAIKKLTDEQKLSTTTVKRNFEINAELIPLRERLAILLGKETEASKELAKAQKEADKAFKDLIRTLDKQFREALKNATTDINEFIKTTQEGFQESIDASNQEVDEIIRNLLAKAQIRLLDAQNLRESIEARKELERAAFQERISQEGLTNDEIELLRRQHQENLTEIEEEGQQQRLENLQKGLEGFENIINIQTNLRLRALERENLDEEEFDKRRKEILRSEAIAKRNIAVFSATIAGLRAVAETLPNIPLSILIGILAAAKVTAIATTQIPQLAEGDVDIQGGEKGKDSIHALLMPGETVTTTKQTRKHKPILQAIHDDKLDSYLKTEYAPRVLNSEFATNVNNSLGYNDGKLIKAVKSNKGVRIENDSMLAKKIARELTNLNYKSKYRGGV